jgi:hypothetical protein
VGTADQVLYGGRKFLQKSLSILSSSQLGTEYFQQMAVPAAILEHSCKTFIFGPSGDNV